MCWKNMYILFTRQRFKILLFFSMIGAFRKRMTSMSLCFTPSRYLNFCLVVLAHLFIIYFFRSWNMLHHLLKSNINFSTVTQRNFRNGFVISSWIFHHVFQHCPVRSFNIFTNSLNTCRPKPLSYPVSTLDCLQCKEGTTKTRCCTLFHSEIVSLFRHAIVWNGTRINFLVCIFASFLIISPNGTGACWHIPTHHRQCSISIGRFLTHLFKNRKVTLTKEHRPSHR